MKLRHSLLSMLLLGTGIALAGCETFDLESSFGAARSRCRASGATCSRKGAPGVQQGIPPDLVQGYQPAAGIAAGDRRAPEGQACAPPRRLTTAARLRRRVRLPRERPPPAATAGAGAPSPQAAPPQQQQSGSAWPEPPARTAQPQQSGPGLARSASCRDHHPLGHDLEADAGFPDHAQTKKKRAATILNSANALSGAMSFTSPLSDGRMSASRPCSTAWSAGGSPGRRHAGRYPRPPRRPRPARRSRLYGDRHRGPREGGAESLTGRMRAQTEAAIAQADAVLFLIDARAGLMPVDRAFADLCASPASPPSLSPTRARARPAERAGSRPMRWAWRSGRDLGGARRGPVRSLRRVARGAAGRDRRAGRRRSGGRRPHGRSASRWSGGRTPASRP